MLAESRTIQQAGPLGNAKASDPQWAWAPYNPDPERPWDLPLAGHLYRRAAFGASWKQLQQALADGPQRTVDKLLQPEADAAVLDQQYDAYEASAAGSIPSLRAWWLRRMLLTPHPLAEKMTLFWHDHFATSNVRVGNPRLMMQHVQLLRKHALGQYGPLLAAVSQDPAMLVGVGADASRKAVPNENFVRQLMDRFTLGPGHYGEEDVQEAARAFTGWFVLRDRLRFVDHEHDTGVKRILGQEGQFGREDVVRIVLKPAMVAQLLARKLYRWFVSETDEPTDELLAPLVDAFGEDYDVGRVVEKILRSNLFFSDAAYRRRIKSPVEFALGIIQGMEGVVGTAKLGSDLADLGQDLYQPPTVEGWEGGRYWLNAATVVGRSNLALALVRGSGPYEDKLNPAKLAEKYGKASPEAAARLLIDLFLQGDVPSDVVDRVLSSGPAADADRSRWLREVTHLIVTLPEYQLA
jgi:uncharacterized protein (DUF1800 family)